MGGEGINRKGRITGRKMFQGRGIAIGSWQSQQEGVGVVTRIDTNLWQSDLGLRMSGVVER